MQQPVTRRAGGNALIASAVVLTGSVLLHPPQPDSLSAYAESAGATWSLAAWLMALAGLLWIAGVVVLARQFNGTREEAWATLGYAGALLGGVALFLVGAIESFGFGGLATGAIFSHTDEAFTALSYMSFSLALLGLAAYYAGVAFFSVAMVRSDEWPAWLGWSGVAIGAASVGVQAVGVTGATQMLAVTLSMTGLVWVVLAGWTLRSLAGPATPARAPAVSADAR